MKSTLHPNPRDSDRARLSLAVTAVVLSACLISTGCVSSQKGKRSSRAAPQVTVLNESFEALKREFNADTSKPRMLALFSPTCGGCIYGAKALQHEAQKIPQAGESAKVLIVWVAMLETDNESEARKSARQFDISGARHFYDGRKQIGARLMAEQFPSAIRDALEILPRDDELRATLEARKDLPPEKMPLWDAVLVFPPGVKWDERSPTPVWWTKQTRFIGEERPGELTAMFWKNSTRQLPVRSDWYLEAREAWSVARDPNSGANQP
jgi:outer membrane murein-binding lipoprotein Lpp